MATPEEIRSLALERVMAGLGAAWGALDGPMLAGLDINTPEGTAVMDEMSRITNTLRDESASLPTPSMVWEIVVGDLPNYSWWESMEFIEGDIDTPGLVEIVGENPGSYMQNAPEGASITKRLTALDLLHAYQAMPQKTHCGGCDIISDPDACSADLILQWAMYGEIVYG